MSVGDVTACLRAWNRGDTGALDRLIPLIYGELKSLAAASLRRERRDHTLGPTALVHEAFLRLVRQRRASWRDRTHFLSLSATLMRRILVDHARRRQGLKRGGDLHRVPLDGAGRPAPGFPVALPGGAPVDLMAVDEALEQLAALDPGQARLVELRFFGGLTESETARVLGVTSRTVRRRWVTARLWLYERLRGAGETGSEGESGKTDARCSQGRAEP